MSEDEGPRLGGDERQYPPYVVTEDQCKRWDLAEGIARLIFDDAGEAQVWQATRSIYYGPIET